jgi:hypothetical protein
MIKLVYVVERKSDITPKDFYDYWLKSHGPRVRGHAKAINAKRYVQSHLIDTERNEALRSVRGMLPPVAGITEVWWDSLGAFQAASASPEGRDALRDLGEDEDKFIDVPKSQVFLTKENFIFDFTGQAKLGSDAIKCTYLLKRRHDLTPEQCHKTWLVDHGPLVASYAHAIRMQRYIQSHTIAPEVNAGFVASRGLAEPLDGITEVWLNESESDSPRDAARAREGGAAMVEDERRFVEMGQSRCFFTREHEIFDYA